MESISCTRVSLFTKVTRVPGGTDSVLGDTPADVMVTVVPPLGVGVGVGVGVGAGVGAGVGDGVGVGAGVGAGAGDGLGEVPPPPPQAAAVSIDAAHIPRIARIQNCFTARISW